jgi:hypothetical protein
MWHRSLAYRKAFKLKTWQPKFTVPDIPEWQAWIFEFNSWQLLKQRCAKRGLRLFQLNKLRRWRAYTRFMKGLAGRLVLAAQHHTRRLLTSTVLGWLAIARGRGRVFRRRIVYFAAWKDWAPKKRRMRQLKELMEMKATKNCALRAVRRWSRCLNNARLLDVFRLRRICDPAVRYVVMTAAYGPS